MTAALEPPPPSPYAEPMTNRAYLIGYDPPFAPMARMTREEVETIMKDCDFCFEAGGEGIAVGEVITCAVHYSGEGGPGMGTAFRCVSHEHHGKVLVLETVVGAS